MLWVFQYFSVRPVTHMMRVIRINYFILFYVTGQEHTTVFPDSERLGNGQNLCVIGRPESKSGAKVPPVESGAIDREELPGVATQCHRAIAAFGLAFGGEVQR
jgi:hypothetical protein